jgi:hypothetical protein
MRAKLAILLLLLSFFFPSLIGATPYYVDQGCAFQGDGTTTSCTNDGDTSDNAWGEIADVNDFAEGTGFSDGDIVNFNRGDKWGSGDEALGNDGSSIDWCNGGTLSGITFQAYGAGAKPEFDGDEFDSVAMHFDPSSPAWCLSDVTIKDIQLNGSNGATGAMIIFWEVDGITLDGVDIDGNAGAGGQSGRRSVSIIRMKGVLNIDGCTLANAGDPSDLTSLAGGSDAVVAEANDVHHIYISNVDACSCQPTSASITNTSFTNATADHMQIVNVQPSGGSNSFVINGNTFTGYGENAIDLKAADDVWISENTFNRNGWGRKDGGGRGVDIAPHNQPGNIDPEVDRLLIEKNTFEYTRYGHLNLGTRGETTIRNNRFSSAETSIFVWGCGENCGGSGDGGAQIINNIFDFTSSTYQGHSPKYAAIHVNWEGSQDGTEIRGNDFYINTTWHKYAIDWNVDSYVVNGVVADNFSYMTRDDPSVFNMRFKDPNGSDTEFPTVSGNSSHNSSANTNRIYWQDKCSDGDNHECDYNELGAYRAIPEVDNSELFDDCLFTDAANDKFWFQGGSGCLGYVTGSSWYITMGSVFPSAVETTTDDNIGAYEASCVPDIPSITDPTPSETGVPLDREVDSSAFADQSGCSTSHTTSDWEICSDSGCNTVLVSTYDDAGNKITWTPSHPENAQLYIRVRHTNSNGDSLWSPAIYYETVGGTPAGGDIGLRVAVTGFVGKWLVIDCEGEEGTGLKWVAAGNS